MSDSTILLNIVSLDKSLYRGPVEFVNVSAEEGELGIYPKHAPLLAALKPGVVTYVINGQRESIYISGGFIEVQPTVVSILADVAIRGTDLDHDRIVAAKQAVEARLATASGEFDQLAAKLKREIAKLRAYELMTAAAQRNNKNQK